MLARFLCYIFGHEWVRSDHRTMTVAPEFKLHARKNVCSYCGKVFKAKKNKLKKKPEQI